MNERELSLIKAVGDAFKEEIARVNATFQETLANQQKAFDLRLEEISGKMKKAEPLPDVPAMVAKAVQSLPLPQAPELPDVEALVKKAVAEIPAPKDGESVTVDDVRPLIEEVVRAEVQALPLPEAPELPDVEALVQKAVAEIPTPKDGESVTVDDVRPLVKDVVREEVQALPVPELPDVEALVQKAVEALPVPQDGKSVTVDDVRPLVKDVVREEVQALPVPELPDVEALVQKAVEALPVPQDGKSVTVDDVRPLIEETVRAEVQALPLPEAPELPDVAALVKNAVAEIPAPQDGKSVTLDEVRPLVEEVVRAEVQALPLPEVPELPNVEEMVQKAMATVEIPEPKHGENGKDALQIEVHPYIDEAKSYPRGTYATHNGGLWRAYEKTHGARGWECVVDGLKGVDVTLNGEREFSVTVTRASGATEQKAFVLPVMIYKGVFHAGDTYQPGDTVTWGGSLWHCDEATNDKPGEPGSKGWTLAAKRGRDGRDKQ